LDSSFPTRKPIEQNVGLGVVTGLLPAIRRQPLDMILILGVIGGAFIGVCLAEAVLLLAKAVAEDLLTRVGVPDVLIQLLFDVIAGALVLGVFALSPVFMIWMERKVSGRMQSRLGPMEVGGWHGWLQTIADGVKLFLKEDIIPRDADALLHRLAPVIVVLASFLCFLVVPFGNRLIAQDLNIGLLYILAISSVTVIGIVTAGWGSNNKYALLGGMRSAAQLVSYEIPRGLSVLGVIMIAGTLQMGQIVEKQAFVPFIILQPLGFLLFLISSIAETNRVPFDLPEAESELVAGFHTEYSGMKFAFFFVAEYCNMLLACAMGTVLFLGGGNEPLTPLLFGKQFLPPLFWFFVKTYVLVFVFMWVRWTLPRLRVDRLMDFGWKFLIPWAFANIILTGLVILMVNG